MTPKELVQQSLALGEQQEGLGNFDASKQHFAEALSICQTEKLRAGLTAIVLCRLAVNATNRGDQATAKTLFPQSIDLFESDHTRDFQEYADCLNHHGHFLRGIKEWAEAIENYAKAYEIYRIVTSLPAKDVQQRRLALRNSLKSTAEQSDDAVRDELRQRVRAMLPRKDSPLFP